MNRYDKYEDWVEVISENLPEIPKIITGEWLKEQLLDRKSYFRNWGFCFADLKEHEFEDNIDASIIRKVPFSTRTIFPENHPFHFNENIFHTFDDVRNLHELGIDGSGVNVAVIDFTFDTVPNELKECLNNFVNLNDKAEVHFHGTTVSTQFCGKNLGIAPKSKLWFYGTGQGKKNIEDDILALKDIYKQNQKGANIKIINISGSSHRDILEFEDIYEKLLQQECYIIDSIIFDENFTTINQDSNTKEYYYSDWQILGMGEKELKSKIAIPTGGKMTPLVTTENDYLYCGQSTYSWGIPILSGYFALALQINPNLTYNEFVELAKKTKTEKEGIQLFNINGIINELNKEKSNKM